MDRRLGLCAWVAAAGLACTADGRVGSERRTATSSAPDAYDFVMGRRDELVGQVLISNDETSLTVRVQVAAGFALANAHVCAATEPFPWTPPGGCPFQQDPVVSPEGATFTVALDAIGPDLCDEAVTLQVHGSILDAQRGAPVGSAYAGTFKGRVVYQVTCAPALGGPGCTQPSGFWPHHKADWPVLELDVGGVPYDRPTLVTLLLEEPRGDVSLLLLAELVAARLNVASGAALPAEIGQALAQADAWMAANADDDGRLPYGLHASDEESPDPPGFDDAVALTALLAAYDRGALGPPPCE